MIRDSLPNNMKYLANTTKLFNSSMPKGAIAKTDTLTTTGINIGDYAVNGNGFVRFSAQVVDKDLVCGNNRLINWAKASANGFAVQDSADVFVNKACKDVPPETPGQPGTQGETPSALPETGPTEIVSGIFGAGSLITVAGYYLASRKQLR